LIAFIDQAAQVVFPQSRKAATQGVPLGPLEVRPGHDECIAVQRASGQIRGQATEANVAHVLHALKEAYSNQLLLVELTTDHAGNLFATVVRPDLRPQSGIGDWNHISSHAKGGG
jgi:hypothetical protein